MNGHPWATIAIISMLTLLCRALPFILWHKLPRVGGFLHFLNDLLPTAIMAFLVVLSLKDLRITRPEGPVTLLSLGFLILLHRLKGNMLLSLFGSTAFYMVLLHLWH